DYYADWDDWDPSIEFGVRNYSSGHYKLIDIDLDLDGLFGSGNDDYQEHDEEDFAMEFNNDLIEAYDDSEDYNMEALDADSEPNIYNTNTISFHFSQVAYIPVEGVGVHATF